MRKGTNRSKTEGKEEVIRETNRIWNCVNTFVNNNNNNNNIFISLKFNCFFSAINVTFPFNLSFVSQSSSLVGRLQS